MHRDPQHISKGPKVGQKLNKWPNIWDKESPRMTLCSFFDVHLLLDMQPTFKSTLFPQLVSLRENKFSICKILSIEITSGLGMGACVYFFQLSNPIWCRQVQALCNISQSPWDHMSHHQLFCVQRRWFIGVLCLLWFLLYPFCLLICRVSRGLRRSQIWWKTHLRQSSKSFILCILSGSGSLVADPICYR